MTNSILITGASGLIGSQLTTVFQQKDYQVSLLGRSAKPGPTPSYVWNVEKGEIDRDALNGIDTIVHLAGAGVADKRWTAIRKREILESRTKSTALLFETLSKGRHQVKTFVSASAIGYYGFGMESTLLQEDSKPGNDYLAGVVREWEREVDRIAALGIRVVKIRIGIVLSEKGGALKEMAAPVRWGVGAPLGTGNQIVSWIHLDDLCGIFMKAVEDQAMRGPYNAVAPQPVTNREMTVALAKILNKPLWLPHVPAFALHWLLGEMADIVINGSRISSEKIQQAGFVFQFEEQQQALKDLLQKRSQNQ